MMTIRVVYSVAGYSRSSGELELELPVLVPLDLDDARRRLGLQREDEMMDCYLLESDVLDYFSQLVGRRLDELEDLDLFFEARQGE